MWDRTKPCPSYLGTHVFYIGKGKDLSRTRANNWSKINFMILVYCIYGKNAGRHGTKKKRLHDSIKHLTKMIALLLVYPSGHQD